MKYIPTIGLEIHAELRTNTKMFCNSKNDPDEKHPNVNICPVCMAHPGTLPTVNKEAVKHVLRVGLAIDGKMADYSEFDRKNYFYPDIPKAYQLSQFEFPLISGGVLNGVEVTRIHLEEDTARSSHTTDTDSSLVDFNRAGVPLLELVTEPVIHSAKEAGDFARELQLLLRTLEVSYANMEKGEMRVEVNISVAPEYGELGTKVEIKNLNSFKVAEKSIAYEITRQSEMLDNGEEIIQETRGWDDDKEVTFSQRIKEESADYRYFPDPDIPKLKISEMPEFSEASLSATLPELPDKKRARIVREYGLSQETVDMYTADTSLFSFYESVVIELPDDNKKETAILASNYLLNNLMALKRTTSTHITNEIEPNEFADIIMLVYKRKVSSNGAVELIERIVGEKGDKGSVHELASSVGLLQENDENTLKTIVQKIITENDAVVAEYKAGKEVSLQYLVGQGMKISQGKANPAKLKEMLQNTIG